ncbi:hypothetical protein KFU94_45455 [Chloroflexi bacterium TSY]|nr:hypothetical protein [Chloroflexi bacterium TSY]
MSLDSLQKTVANPLYYAGETGPSQSDSDIQPKTTRKIGLLVGDEWSFPPAFIEEVNKRNVHVQAEFVSLGGTYITQKSPYTLLLDRISHHVAYYRSFLAHAQRQGSYVLNEQAQQGANDRFVAASVAAMLDIPTPRAVVLPMRAYSDEISAESLRNLEYPLDWAAIAKYVGFPAILKPVDATVSLGSNDVAFVLNSVEELLFVYNQTGQQCMMLQQAIAGQQVRCICIGREGDGPRPDGAAMILPMVYDAARNRSLPDDSFLTSDFRTLITEQAQALHHALGHDLNCVTFVVSNERAIIIDATNPIPDLDINHLTPRYFQQVVKALADFCIGII